jgi:hypothetical protein
MTGSLHCVTNTGVGTGKNTEKHTFPLAGQISHGCKTVNLFVSKPSQKYFPSEWGRIHEKGAWI